MTRTDASPMTHPQPRWKDFAALAKSGIVTLVVISVGAGYLIGQSFEHPFHLPRFLLTLIGILLLSGGSGALNQVQEHEIDRKMPRTQGRPLPAGKVSLKEAWVFVTFSIISGTLILAWIHPILLGLGVFAVLSYNGLYTLWWKRKMPFAAIPGAIPGALPILMGYLAAQPEPSLNLHAAAPGYFLFALLFYWQMPHFWVLALKYREDYAQGGFPTLPVALGTEKTAAHIAFWGLGYAALPLVAPGFFPALGSIYMACASLTSLWVLVELFRFQKTPQPTSGTTQGWLRFFLSVNFSLILYLLAMVVDLWSIYLLPRISNFQL
jgi:protoheme IX farnesyltransferase